MCMSMVDGTNATLTLSFRTVCHYHHGNSTSSWPVHSDLVHLHTGAPHGQQTWSLLFPLLEDAKTGIARCSLAQIRGQMICRGQSPVCPHHQLLPRPFSSSSFSPSSSSSSPSQESSIGTVDHLQSCLSTHHHSHTLTLSQTRPQLLPSPHYPHHHQW